jgi:hypothetical protein
MLATRRAAWLGMVFLLAGCQSRLNVDQSYHLDVGGSQSFEIDPPRYEQKVTLSVETDAPVTVFVFLKKDADAVAKDITLKGKSDKLLATWTGDSKGTVEATVPAHEIAMARIDAAAKAANVKVKIVGK